ncbi:hypothetical protein Sste5346_003360 [Sporothrix stenoceras]|uniref:FAD-binding FR-type domain-containing protein n=1 Tax=Sporothrix stenoceras TaxID=5173 RepID=A0ABR3ZDY6_9PEZI
MAPQNVVLAHTSSRRVTAGISFHSFGHEATKTEEAPASQRWLRPTQNVTLQFPTDLDPAGGKHGLSETERRCTFTPCAATRDGLSILTRNGRITGLLGLPRPYQTLAAEVVDVGGGFSEDALSQSSVCIAGGTGIAPFLTMDATSSKTLCWSTRSDDFGAVEFALKETLIRPDEWLFVSIFVTSGEDAGGLVAEKPAAWWEETFKTLKSTYAGNINFYKRRIATDDLVVEKTKGDLTILFCGSKSLEWQIRMWTMGQATVFCTEIE